MSDQKNDEIKKVVNMYADAEKQEREVRGSTGDPVAFSALTDALRSQNGLTQIQAGILLNGSEANYKNADPNGSRTRGKIRDAWRSINSSDEVSVSHKGSKHKQVYFIVSREGFKFWHQEYIIEQGLGEKLDTGILSKNDPGVIKNLVRS